MSSAGVSQQISENGVNEQSSFSLPSFKRRWDGRNAIYRIKDLIRILREFGYKDEDRIPYEDLEYEIQMNFGCDSRTVRKYLALAVSLDYLKPAGRLLSVRKSITVRTEQGIHPREYSSFKGYSHYVFGVRAPRFYQETLNPKYVSPAPPSEEFSFNECLVGQENMCATRMGSQVSVSEAAKDINRQQRYLGFIEKKIENKKEEELCDAHILLDTKREEGEEKDSFAEKTEKKDLTLVSNTVSNLVSNTLSNSVSNKPELDTKNKSCPRCGKKGCLCSRYVLNSRKRRYGLYFYFKHYDRGRVKWCYLGRKKPRRKLEDDL